MLYAQLKEATAASGQDASVSAPIIAESAVFPLICCLDRQNGGASTPAQRN
jgi:hypothetical protein